MTAGPIHRTDLSASRLYPILLVLLGLALTADQAQAADQRPFRGSVGMSVLLCKYKGEPTPANGRSFYEDLAIKAGTGGHADYWNAVSFGGVDLKGSTVHGWYTLDQTADEARAYGGGGSADRGKKFSDCVDKAKTQGYSPPSDHIVIVITSPDIDTFGFGGGAFLGEGASVGIMSHEVGHGLTLAHSFSDDPNFQAATWSGIGEYDDQWDMMSYANVFSMNTGTFGFGGPGLNAYHRDRMGWIRRDKILRFGANGQSDRTVTLTALNRPNGTGYQMVRIPFDTNDRYRYFTVEYRVNEDWDAGFSSDAVLIHEVKEQSDGSYRSYLLRNHTGARAPRQSINREGVQIDVLSKDRANDRATVRIRSSRVDRCLQGYVWREAHANDKVCVTALRRAAVRNENQLAGSRRQPGGGAYGPDTCKQGYVWREAYSNDHVCVPPASRSTARQENLLANERRLASAAYGPNTCKQGYVWREADQSDWVCVTPQRRTEVSEENRLAASRRRTGGGAYGPDSCKQGYVWREAYTGDHVCVAPASRSKARQENESASDRLAKKGA
jgi:hypothetical protein